MNIEYENGQQVVTHPSGHVDRYTKQDLVDFKDRLSRKTVRLNSGIIAIDLMIAEVENSKGT